MHLLVMLARIKKIHLRAFEDAVSLSFRLPRRGLGILLVRLELFYRAEPSLPDRSARAMKSAEAPGKIAIPAPWGSRSSQAIKLVPFHLAHI